MILTGGLSTTLWKALLSNVIITEVDGVGILRVPWELQRGEHNPV